MSGCMSPCLDVAAKGIRVTQVIRRESNSALPENSKQIIYNPTSTNKCRGIQESRNWQQFDLGSLLQFSWRDVDLSAQSGSLDKKKKLKYNSMDIMDPTALSISTAPSVQFPKGK